ncbi:DUF3348 domain-containing protein [Alcanivorax sp.]|uniref:DUF3348 domain-containing protein n=1 Tax=Alcanivorax sp. TaxID=1872427 RepID=UPI0032D92204
MYRTQTPAQTGPAGSRLVQLLASLDPKAAASPHPCFAERLGRLFDLSDTIALDAATQHRPKGPFIVQHDISETLQADLLKTRNTLLENLSHSFAGKQAASVISLPALNNDSPAGKRPTFGPYERFHQAHQRQMIAALSNLRLRTRRQLTAHSAELARLAELDAVFDHSLSAYVRRCFSAMPAFLEKRYRTLWQQGQHTPPQHWMATNGWLTQFCKEIQMLLLAELDARQEPILGLLDAAAGAATDAGTRFSDIDDKESTTP